jgi:hypothetical protein
MYNNRQRPSSTHIQSAAARNGLVRLGSGDDRVREDTLEDASSIFPDAEPDCESEGNQPR